MNNNFKDKKFALFATIAVISTVFGVTQFDNITAQEQEIPQKFVIVNEHRTAESILSENGVNSAISVTPSEKQLKLGDDNSVVTTLQISHQANDVRAKAVSVEADGVVGIYVPKSNVDLEKSTQQIVDEFKATGTISGSLDLSSFVTFTPSNVEIAAGETATIQMQITIPQNIIDSLEEESLDFNPNVYRTIQYEDQKIGMYNDGSVTVLLGDRN